MAPDRRRARHDALIRSLDAEALDGLLVSSRANVRYLTGFSGSAALVAVTRGDVLRETLAQVRAGMTELAIAGVLEGALRRRGSEGHPFATIVASGPRSALPHARSSRRTVAVGEWLLLDFGAQVDGYCADITRTVVVGARASEPQRVLYELVRDAQRRARTAVRAGMSGREADALAREPIAARGFEEAFGHSLGHGLGREVH